MTERIKESLNFKQLSQMGVVFLFYLCFLSTYASAEGEVRNLKDFEYWEGGKVRQCTVYDASSGKLKAKAFYGHYGALEKIEKYDDCGNKTEEALFDGKDRLKAGIDGWAAKRWWYDGSHLRAQISYDEYGKPRERKEYSESGKLILRQYKDDNKANPYEDAAMFMMLGGRNVAYYDSKGAVEEATRIMRE